MLNFITRTAVVLSEATGYRPLHTTVIIFLFYVLFNSAEANVEQLIWGERFAHAFDAIFMAAGILYGVLCVGICYRANREGVK